MFLHLCVILFTRGVSVPACTTGHMIRGVSVQGVSVWGVSVQGVSVQWGLCPGGRNEVEAR